MQQRTGACRCTGPFQDPQANDSFDGGKAAKGMQYFGIACQAMLATHRHQERDQALYLMASPQP